MKETKVARYTSKEYRSSAEYGAIESALIAAANHEAEEFHIDGRAIMYGNNRTVLPNEMAARLKKGFRGVRPDETWDVVYDQDKCLFIVSASGNYRAEKYSDHADGDVDDAPDGRDYEADGFSPLQAELLREMDSEIATA